MRRIATFLLLAWLVVFGGMSPAAARTRFGITAGPQLTQLSARSYDLLGRPDVTWSWTGYGGLSAERALRGSLALAGGLEYGENADHYGWSMIFTGGGMISSGQFRRQMRLRTVSLPARIEWRPGRWRLGAGPEARYLVRADQRWQSPPLVIARATSAAAPGRGSGPRAVIFESVRLDQWYDVTSAFRRWSLAAQFAVGREFPLGAHAIRADLRWSEGLTDQQKAASVTQRTRAAQLALGLLW